jgi:hypothetical protein
MKTSEELFGELKKIHKSAEESIVSILKSHNSKADFTIDENGKESDDEDYDSDFEYENRVWIECYGKYDNETGYVSMVELGASDNIIVTAEGEDFTYDTDYVCHSTPVYLDILERLEFMEENGMFKD